MGFLERTLLILDLDRLLPELSAIWARPAENEEVNT